MKSMNLEVKATKLVYVCIRLRFSNSANGLCTGYTVIIMCNIQ